MENCLTTCGFARLLPALLVTLAVAACGGGDGGAAGRAAGGVSGVYVPQGDSLWKKFDFQANNKVDVTNFTGETAAGEYAVMSDGRIRVMVAGEVLTLKKGSDGCLVPTVGDAQEAQQAERMGATEQDLAQLGRFCKE
jgi:hypothetical protein